MAARRGKSQARRSSAQQNGMPGWAWLLIGVLLTIVVILLAPRFIGAYKEGNTGFFSIGNTAPTPEPLPQPDAASTPAFEPAPATPTNRQGASAHQAPPKTRDFDFYEVLPNEEVPLTDTQLAAIQREEARRLEEARRREQADAAASQTPAPSPATTSDSAAAQAADAQARATAAAAAANAQLPRPLPEVAPSPPEKRTPPATSPVAAPAPKATTSTSRAATTAPTVTNTTAKAPALPPTRATTTPAAASNATQAAARSAPYIVQAGAFRASSDAEAAKARIALLGLSARVESTQVNGGTIYRVRLGPYGSAAEAAAAKQKLEGGGVPAITQQVK